ncbi:MAG: hypothetical protein IJ137_10410 [Eubacterium sp.]|nr:hypothetical protein [Eubacterium sp.]
MAEEKNKKRRFHLNIGSIIFLVIVVYLTASVVRDMNREKLAVYEVNESIIDDEIKSSGVILRKEYLQKLGQSGYVNYYLGDGARVSKTGVVYTVDSSGKLTSYLDQLTRDKKSVSQEEKELIFNDLKALSEGFSDDRFSEIYDVRNTINYDLMAYSDTIIADNREEIKEKFGESGITEMEAPAAGLVSYFSDGLEELTFKKIDQNTFDKKPDMEDLRQKGKLEKDTPIYRLVTSQKWTLALSVTEDEYNRLKRLKKNDVSTVQVTFLKDNFTTRASFDCKKNDLGYFALLRFENYVQRYINQRYLSVRLLLQETRGLKIPSSSLVEKKVYKVPTRFLTKGSNSDASNQVNVLTESKKGEKLLHQQTVTTYPCDEEYTYISSDKLKKGDIIASLDKTDRFELLETTTIQGVFMVNRGYAVYKIVEIIRRNEDYCIVSPELSTIDLYDRIILNSDTIKEGDVIY